jgi:hypothetical protein
VRAIGVRADDPAQLLDRGRAHPRPREHGRELLDASVVVSAARVGRGDLRPGTPEREQEGPQGEEPDEGLAGNARERTR